MRKPIIDWVFATLGGTCEFTALPGRANSRVHRVNFGKSSFCLKIYPDRLLDPRDRLGAEFNAFDQLRAHGIDKVPQPMARNVDQNAALYEWIDGEHPAVVNVPEVKDALSLIRRLRTIKDEPAFHHFPPASEACLSVAELQRQIERRAQLLREVQDPRLEDFLAGQFNQVYHRLQSNAPVNQELPTRWQSLSPSDFGFHNALRRPSGNIIYIDFEYFGHDDPVKLTSDFLWHDAMELSVPARVAWMDGMSEIFDGDPGFDTRFKQQHPLYGLRWCLIVLNEFLPERRKIREHANPGFSERLEEVLCRQMAKAQRYLHAVEEGTMEMAHV